MKTILTLLAITLASVPAFAGELLVSDSANTDVQTLQAWRGREFYTGESINLWNCRTISSASGYDSSGQVITWDRRDCSEEFEHLLGKPVAHEVSVQTYRDSSGLTAPYFRCAATEIRTVTRADVLNSPVFRGIGFYHNERGGLRLIKKDKLQDYGPVILKDGTPARVQGFVAFAKCWKGTVSSSLYRKEEFKPFAEYGVQSGIDTLIYRRWEDVESNLALGQLYGYDSENRIESFDRQWELLRQ